MKKICMIVLNNVIRDPRVMKESASLTEAGYDVSVIGITDNTNSSLFTHLPNGTRIYRYGKWVPKKRKESLIRYMFNTVMLAAFMTGVIAITWRQEPYVGFVSVLLITFFLCSLGLFAWENRISIMNMKGPKSFRLPLRLRRFGQFTERKLSELDPDIVHCHDLLMLPIGVSYTRKHPSVKCIYDSHEIFEEQSQIDRWRHRLYYRMQKKSSRYVDGFITVNDSIAEFLKQRYPKLPKATVVMNAIEYDGEQITYNGCLHEAAELPPETKILLFHGGFARFRGLTHLVLAGHDLPEDWAIVLMGNGRLEPNIRETILSKNLQNVRLVEPVPREDLLDWTAGATVGIIPYENVCMNHWYCSPNKLWEYPAAGVPILASSLEVMNTMIKENGIGWILPERITPRAIADTIASITEEDLEEKRRNCRRFIDRDNWSVYEKRLLGLYDSLLASEPTRTPNA